jgi:hypothetical protein
MLICCITKEISSSSESGHILRYKNYDVLLKCFVSHSEWLMKGSLLQLALDKKGYMLLLLLISS